MPFPELGTWGEVGASSAPTRRLTIVRLSRPSFRATQRRAYDPELQYQGLVSSMRRRLGFFIGLGASLVALAAVSGSGVADPVVESPKYESRMGVARLPRHTFLVWQSRGTR